MLTRLATGYVSKPVVLSPPRHVRISLPSSPCKSRLWSGQSKRSKQARRGSYEHGDRHLPFPSALLCPPPPLAQANRGALSQIPTRARDGFLAAESLCAQVAERAHATDLTRPHHRQRDGDEIGDNGSYGSRSHVGSLVAQIRERGGRRCIAYAEMRYHLYQLADHVHGAQNDAAICIGFMHSEPDKKAFPLQVGL